MVLGFPLLVTELVCPGDSKKKHHQDTIHMQLRM